MALIDIVTNINTTLAYYYANKPGPQTLYTGLGKGGVIAQDKAPPAVIWVPTGDSYEGVQAYQGTSKAAVRPLCVRAIGVDAWLWAAVPAGATEDFSALDRLVVATIGAVHSNLLGAYRRTGGRYYGLDDQEPQAFGRAYVLSLQFLELVPELTLETQSVVVTQVPQTNQAKFPSGSIVTNP
jgi:hypothetical protein